MRGKSVEKEGVLRQLMNIIYAIPVVILALRSELGLTVKETFYILLGYAVAISLFRISKAVEQGIIVKVQTSNSSGSEEKKRKEEVRTSGAGAFAGMIAGGAIGLLFGPVGAVIGGILGALVGNQIEYENIKTEREKEET
jgi:uncharacterized membrane protein